MGKGHETGEILVLCVTIHENIHSGGYVTMLF